jgi:hypothetical protein
MSRQIVFALTLLLGLPALARAQPSGGSFEEVWRVVKETRPYTPDEDLPARNPLKRPFPKSLIPDEIRAVFFVRAKNYATSDSNLVLRSRTTTDPGRTNDLRGANRDNPKPLHPLGITFAARWEIGSDSPFTGLFAPGVRLPYAIVRVSSGTREATSRDKRIMGLAIKLFPTQDPKKKVLTRNILTLDQFGFDSDTRMRPFHSDSGQGVYYTNFAPPNDPNAFLPRNLNRFFNHFDAPNEHRPVEALAEVDAEGQPIKGKPCAPFEIVFRPLFQPRFRVEEGKPKAPRVKRLKSFRQNPRARADFEQGVIYNKLPYDFRDLIRAYDPADELKFEICYVAWGPGRSTPTPLGTLTITSEAVVSDGGDLDLHFHHLIHPEQPEKGSGKQGLIQSLDELKKSGCPLGH